MYDELVKALHEGAEFLECSTPGIKNSFAKMCHNAADAIEELQADKAALNGTVTNLLEQIKDLRKSRWIPVTERLPEEAGCYLVAVKNDHKRRYSKTAWFSHDSWFARQDVTHWMPLPEPPKEE
jgi:hypothetical protein